MMMAEPLRFAGLRGHLTHDAPLAKHTSWRAGGAAERYSLRTAMTSRVVALPANEPPLAIGWAATRSFAMAASVAPSS
jgi:hypothetical protein